MRSTIAPDDRTLPIMAGLLQDEPAVRVRDGIRPGTVTVNVSISSPVLAKPLTYRNVYASAGDVVALASGQAARLVAILGQNSIREVPISAIRVDERIQPAVRAARIVSASVRPRRVAAGGRAILSLRLQPWRDTARAVRVAHSHPRRPELGKAVLRVVPKSSDGFDPFPADLAQNLEASTPVAAGADRPRRTAWPPSPRAVASTGSWPACAGPPTIATTPYACWAPTTTPTPPRRRHRPGALRHLRRPRRRPGDRPLDD